MSEENRLGFENDEVRSYLDMLERTISRMWKSSTQMKAWCVTLVSALMVLLLKEGPEKGLTGKELLIILGPIILFAFLDSFYLTLERGFRSIFESVAKKAKANVLESNDLYLMKPENPTACKIFLTFKTSLSLWPFYLGLSIMILAVYLGK